MNPTLVNEVAYAKICRRRDPDHLLLTFLMVFPVLADPLEDSTNAYRRGDYKTAYQLIKPQAEKGDAAAQLFLGFMYDEGKGVPQDFDEAAKWYRRAAKQGNKTAQHNLDLMDAQAQVPKGNAEMEKWHRKATESGNPSTQSNLGLMDDQGQVSKDRAEMEKWYRKAAEPENAAARSIPGLMDDQDQVSKDSAEMEKWHRRTAE